MIFIVELHLVIQTMTDTVAYVVYDLTTGQFSQPIAISAYLPAFLAKQQISLYKEQVMWESFPSDRSVNCLVTCEVTCNMLPVPCSDSSLAFYQTIIFPL